MAFDRFLIAPLNSGMQTNVRPWLIPDDAFAQMYNAYVFRGRVRKRFGSFLMNPNIDPEYAQYFSRLRVLIGSTDALGDYIGNLYTITSVPTLSIKVGQQFMVNDVMSNIEIFTVSQLGLPAPLLTTGAGTATLNTTTGDLTITGSIPLSPIYFFILQPVMGLITYETTPINDEPTYAFDQTFAYFYTASGWDRLGTAYWTGTDSEFFWGTTYRGQSNASDILYVTNYNPADAIKYWNGTLWNTITPVLNSTDRLQTARVVVPFKNRLLSLNVVETTDGSVVGTTAAVTGNFGPVVVGVPPYSIGQSFVIGNTIFTIISTVPGPQAMQVNAGSPMTGTFDVATGTVTITGNNYNASTPVYFLPNNYSSVNNRVYRNRCRFSQNGSPLEYDAWFEQTPGKGGFIDCPTQEAIVSAEFLKDRLIVFFERSTWEIAYTGNQISPFVWQKINTELGSESTFSIVPFDKVVLGIGNVGIHACNGINVERIDEKIPDTVFEIHNDNEGVYRVVGIRDYKVEMVYWTFPDENFQTIYPTRVLVYNYRTGSWAFNNDSITMFGYFQNLNYLTWENWLDTWQDSFEQWDSGSNQSKFRQVLGGNQQGWTFICDPDHGRNAPALTITDITLTPDVTLSIINHNLRAGDFILIENCIGVTGLNDTTFKVQDVIDSNTISLGIFTVTGTYQGNGTAARVSRIDIYTKQYNFYVKDDRNAYIQRVDFLVDKTVNGAITVDYFPSTSDESMIENGLATGALTGNGVLETFPYPLYPLEASQRRLWHPVYLQASGQCIQLRLYFSDLQMLNADITLSDFELHAMIFFAQPTSYRLQ